ncbi:MAG: hypothetical protein ACTSSL_13495 [Candidatus Heimdallarchaeaceae archaeon]
MATGQIKQDSGTARIFDTNVESQLKSKYKLRISYDLLFYVKFFALCLAREKTKGSLIS